MQLSNHGGRCCGIHHVHSMGNTPNDYDTSYATPAGGVALPEGLHTKGDALIGIIGYFDNFYREAPLGEGGLRMMEVTLTDAQERGWHGRLVELGFKKTLRFFNRNSGNNVNIYYRHRGGFEIFDTSDQVPDQVVGRIEPVVQEQPVPHAPAQIEPVVQEQPVPQAPAQDVAQPDARRVDPHNLFVIPDFDDLEIGTPVYVLNTTRGAMRAGTVGGLPFDRTGSILIVMSDTLRSRQEFLRNLLVDVFVEPEPVEEVPEPELLGRRVLSTRYFARLRTGERRGPFMTLETVQRVYGRCRNFEMVTTFSDGATITQERPR